LGFLDSLRRGLERTRQRFAENLSGLFAGRREVDAPLAQALEEALIAADVGPATAERLLAAMREELDRDPRADAREALERAVRGLLSRAEGRFEPGPERPWVVLVLGVNGAGKTTLAGKLASHFQRQGLRVMLVAADTFRAAAVDQLEVWARRAGADFVRQRSGADPAAVVHDALSAAVARGTDVVLVDTAGRLHTKHNLMVELEKLGRVAGKRIAGAPHHNLLVLDASLGQNSVEQARQFHEALPITSIAVTKLDGSARGGAVLAIADQLGLPISIVGVGEGVDDWGPLDAREFAAALLE
jgi:fused signal recognition particle receptor